jgi:hypothetical protein
VRLPCAQKGRLPNKCSSARCLNGIGGAEKSSTQGPNFADHCPSGIMVRHWETKMNLASYFSFGGLSLAILNVK